MEGVVSLKCIAGISGTVGVGSIGLSGPCRRRIVKVPVSAPETGRESIHDQNIPGPPSQPTGPLFGRCSDGLTERALRRNRFGSHFAEGR